MTITATLFKSPNGKREVIQISNINFDDAEYINQNNVKVSLETLSTGHVVMYFDDGHYINDDPSEDPDEIMIFSDQIKKSCTQYIREGVEELKKRNLIKNEGAEE